MEENAEFLQSVDAAPPVMVEDDPYQTLESVKTVLHPVYAPNTFYSYGRVPWSLKIRKEVFSPSEVVKSPLALNLIFCQVRHLNLLI